MITEEAATPNMDAFFEEYARLKQAAKLLEDVYLAVGPYPHKEKGALYGLDMLEEPWREVRRFFNFDDSE